MIQRASAAAPRVQTYRSRALSGFGIAAFLGVPIAALLVGGIVNVRDGSKAPRDVALAELSDPGAVHAETRVRVTAAFEPRTATTTSRGHVLSALSGAPNVIVFCDSVAPGQCTPHSDAPVVLVGEVTDARDDMSGQAAVSQFAKDVLHRDRSGVRILKLTWQSSASGDRVRATIAFSIAGVLFLLAMALLIAGFVFRSRALKDGSWRT